LEHVDVLDQGRARVEGCSYEACLLGVGLDKVAGSEKTGWVGGRRRMRRKRLGGWTVGVR
jgi:hypothetical protein